MDAFDSNPRKASSGVISQNPRVRAAHAARRGSTDSFETLTARAETRYLQQIGIGPREREFSKLLDAEGIEYRQQLRVGIYNLDFALTGFPIAVEIVWGSGNTHVRATRAQRLKRLLDEWHVFEVRATAHCRNDAISPEVVKKLIAFMEVASPDHPAPRLHRVVRPDGGVLGQRPNEYSRTSKNGTRHLVRRAITPEG